MSNKVLTAIEDLRNRALGVIADRYQKLAAAERRLYGKVDAERHRRFCEAKEFDERLSKELMDYYFANRSAHDIIDVLGYLRPIAEAEHTQTETHFNAAHARIDDLQSKLAVTEKHAREAEGQLAKFKPEYRPALTTSDYLAYKHKKRERR